jgi:thioredoxin-like negative regulator of GroEL
MSEIIHITGDNFEEEVLKASQPTIVDFTAVWCGLKPGMAKPNS